EQLASQLLARLADDGAEAGRLRGQAEAGLRQAGGARPLATSLEGHEALLRTLPVSCGVHALAALPDGRLACGSLDNTIHLWDPDTGTRSGVLEGHRGMVSALAVLPDGRLASGSDDSTIRLWDPTRPDGAPKVLFVADAAITALLAHPTRPLLVAGDGSGRLHWLELAGRATTQRGGQRPAAAG
ncbi:MAG: hypothetical protein VKO26_05085, partial [Cyanobacteriota bacterium]|nr:hypothetical protein [Cyanobacteriota bacterium]